MTLFLELSIESHLKPALNHMHHLISRKYNNKILYLCLQVTIIINLFLYHLIENKIFILIFVIFLYFSLMITFKNYIKK